MAKKPLNVLIEADLIQKARDHGLIIGKFLENKLQEYFSFIDAVDMVDKKMKRPGRDSDPSPKLDRLG